MRNWKYLAAGVLAAGVSLSGLRLFSHAAAYDAQIPAYAEEILAAQCGGQDVQSWIDNELPAMVGNSSPDWYAMALSHQGYDLSAYAAALENYIDTNEITSATSRERMALALCACKTPAPACCAELLENSAGQLGIMSWIFALHLLHNGVNSAQYRTNDVADILVDYQLADGGWAVSGVNGDTDVTAMTLQALAPCIGRQTISDAVERGVNFLADTQLSNGGYQSWETENPESTAQVWIALSALGIDPLTDERFIKDGTILESLLEYRTGNGQYCHIKDGAANKMATVQTYLAYRAAEMCENNEGSLFLFANQADEPVEPAVTSTVQTAQGKAVVTAQQIQSASGSESEGTVPAKTGSLTEETTKTNVTATKLTTNTTECKTSDSASEEITDTAILSQISTKITAAATGDQSVHSVKRYTYRLPATVVTLAIFTVIAGIFYIRKKRSYKTFLTIAGVAGAAILLIWTLRFETKSQYYTKTDHVGGGSVTMSIRCDVICGLPGSEAFPADGVIMPETTLTIEENESVLTLLYDAVRENALQIEVDGVSNEVLETAYVRGIEHLYEFDFGDLSGWTYTVNGERPPVGCGAYTLRDGDVVVWAYTVDL